MSIKKLYVTILKNIELGSAIAVRLTKYIGKSKEYIHPKHFLEPNPWFVKYFKKNDIVLDLGSGNGQNAIKLAHNVKKVIGLEIDNYLIGIARRTANDKKIKNLKFKQANLENDLGLKKRSFDKVIFLDVLEHLNNRDKIIEDVRTVLKPEGLLFIGVPNKNTSWKKLQRSVGVSSLSDPDHKIEYSKSQIEKLLKKHKFEIVDSSHAPYDTPFRGLFDIVGAFSLTLYKKIYNWRKRKADKNPEEASGFQIVARKS